MSYTEEKVERKQLRHFDLAEYAVFLKSQSFRILRGFFVLLRRKALINCIAKMPREWRHVYSDPSLYRASPTAASLYRGIVCSAFLTVNFDWLKGVTVV